MKLSIISGSGQPDSQSAKVGRFLEKMAQSVGFKDVFFLDLGSDPLPIWSTDFKSAATLQGRGYSEIESELEASEAFIVISPEWHGMATAILKNFFLYFSGGGVLAHKPALLVGVSAARGGAYPIAELRMSSYKNSHLCYIPEHLIVRNVGAIMNSQQPETDEDKYIQARASFSVKLLKEYAEALQTVRSSGLNFSDYPNGM